MTSNRAPQQGQGQGDVATLNVLTVDREWNANPNAFYSMIDFLCPGPHSDLPSMIKKQTSELRMNSHVLIGYDLQKCLSQTSAHSNSEEKCAAWSVQAYPSVMNHETSSAKRQESKGLSWVHGVHVAARASFRAQFPPIKMPSFWGKPSFYST